MAPLVVTTPAAATRPPSGLELLVQAAAPNSSSAIDVCVGAHAVVLAPPLDYATVASSCSLLSAGRFPLFNMGAFCVLLSRPYAAEVVRRLLERMLGGPLRPMAAAGDPLPAGAAEDGTPSTRRDAMLDSLCRQADMSDEDIALNATLLLAAVPQATVRRLEQNLVMTFDRTLAFRDVAWSEKVDAPPAAKLGRMWRRAAADKRRRDSDANSASLVDGGPSRQAVLRITRSLSEEDVVEQLQRAPASLRHLMDLCLANDGIARSASCFDRASFLRFTSLTHLGPHIALAAALARRDAIFQISEIQTGAASSPAEEGDASSPSGAPTSSSPIAAPPSAPPAALSQLSSIAAAAQGKRGATNLAKIRMLFQQVHHPSPAIPLAASSSSPPGAVVAAADADRSRRTDTWAPKGDVRDAACQTSPDVAPPATLHAVATVRKTTAIRNVVVAVATTSSRSRGSKNRSPTATSKPDDQPAEPATTSDAYRADPPVTAQPDGQPKADAQPAAKPDADQPTTAQPDSQPAAAQPADQPATAKPDGQPATAQPADQPATAQPDGQPKASAQPSAKPDADQHATAQPDSQPAAAQPADQPATAQPDGQPKADAQPAAKPDAQPADQPATAQPDSQPAAAQPADHPTAAQPADAQPSPKPDDQPTTAKADAEPTIETSPAHGAPRLLVGDLRAAPLQPQAFESAAAAANACGPLPDARLTRLYLGILSRPPALNSLRRDVGIFDRAAAPRGMMRALGQPYAPQLHDHASASPPPGRPSVAGGWPAEPATTEGFNTRSTTLPPAVQGKVGMGDPTARRLSASDAGRHIRVLLAPLPPYIRVPLGVGGDHDGRRPPPSAAMSPVVSAADAVRPLPKGVGSQFALSPLLHRVAAPRRGSHDTRPHHHSPDGDVLPRRAPSSTSPRSVPSPKPSEANSATTIAGSPASSSTPPPPVVGEVVMIGSSYCRHSMPAHSEGGGGGGGPQRHPVHRQPLAAPLGRHGVPMANGPQPSTASMVNTVKRDLETGAFADTHQGRDRAIRRVARDLVGAKKNPTGGAAVSSEAWQGTSATLLSGVVADRCGRRRAEAVEKQRHAEDDLAELIAVEAARRQCHIEEAAAVEERRRRRQLAVSSLTDANDANHASSSPR
mgnify:CR=1 FL=1